MAKCRRLNSPTIEVDSRDLNIVVRVENEELRLQSEHPASPPLESHEFNELWGDVLAASGATQDSTEDSTQTPSSPLDDSHRARKRKVRTHDQDPDFSATTLKDLYSCIGEDPQVTEDDIKTLDRYLPSKIVDNTRD